MPIVRLVSDGVPNTEVVSISLEETPVVLSDIRRALPMLKKDMQKKWPTLSDVHISYTQPRIKNPIDYKLSALLIDGSLRLAASFVLGVAGREIIKPPAQEIGKYLRRWVQKFTKSKPKRRRSKSRKRRSY